jgi:hypothetical protein
VKNQLVRLLAVLLLHVAAGGAEASVSPSLADRIEEQTLPTGVFRFLFQPTTALFLKFVKNWKLFVCLNSNRASKGWASHLIHPKWDFRFAMSKFLLRALTPVQLMPGGCEWWSG